MNQHTRYRELVDRALSGAVTPADVEAFLLELGGGVHGDLPAAPDQRDLGLDLLGAIRELEPEDPSYWWNHAGTLAREALHFEAAAAYTKAAQLIDAGHGDDVASDSNDAAHWGAASRYHAAKSLLAAHRPLSAALIVPRIADDELRTEVEQALRAEVLA
jgi:hypothetical protein